MLQSGAAEMPGNCLKLTSNNYHRSKLPSMSVMYEVSSATGNRLDAAAAIRNAARVRPHDTVKNHMMRFLKRSKSMAHRAPSNNNNSYNHNEKTSDNNANGKPHVQVARNGVVVAIVDGLPFVVGNKSKKVCSSSTFFTIP
ncbi:hypothetical protein CBL_11358 [Carabus blaptoides fortunei]